MTYDGTLHIAYDGTLHIAPGVQAPAEAVFEASTSAEVIRRWVRPPTQATHPSGRITRR